MPKNTKDVGNGGRKKRTRQDDTSSSIHTDSVTRWMERMPKKKGMTVVTPEEHLQVVETANVARWFETANYTHPIPDSTDSDCSDNSLEKRSDESQTSEMSFITSASSSHGGPNLRKLHIHVFLIFLLF